MSDALAAIVCFPLPGCLLYAACPPCSLPPAPLCIHRRSAALIPTSHSSRHFLHLAPALACCVLIVSCRCYRSSSLYPATPDAERAGQSFTEFRALQGLTECDGCTKALQASVSGVSVCLVWARTYMWHALLLRMLVHYCTQRCASSASLPAAGSYFTKTQGIRGY